MAKKPRVKRALSPYNRHVQREMKAGRSMKQAAASWKSGSKRTSVRRISVPRRKTRSRAVARKPRSTGGRRKMGGFNSQKIMKYIRLVALGAPVATALMSPADNAEKVDMVIRNYTGYSPKYGNFHAERLAAGWAPYLASVVTTYGIPKLAGIIRGL